MSRLKRILSAALILSAFSALLLILFIPNAPQPEANTVMYRNTQQGEEIAGTYKNLWYGLGNMDSVPAITEFHPEFSPGTLSQGMTPAMQQMQSSPVSPNGEESMSGIGKNDGGPSFTSAPAGYAYFTSAPAGSASFSSAPVSEITANAMVESPPVPEQPSDPSTEPPPLVQGGPDPLIPPELEPSSETAVPVPEPGMIVIFATGIVCFLPAVKIDLFTRKKISEP